MEDRGTTVHGILSTRNWKGREQGFSKIVPQLSDTWTWAGTEGSIVEEIDE